MSETTANGILVKPLPRDIVQMAENFVPASVTEDFAKWRSAIGWAIAAERRRCANIVDAESEWGGDIRECERKINSGEGPRRIPGYNAPSEGD